MSDTDSNNNLDEAAMKGKDNILKFFYRIHDKPFSFNNILIIGYFTRTRYQFEKHINSYNKFRVFDIY